MSEDAKKDTLDLSAMLDENLDQVPDAPEFLLPPAGQYNLEVLTSKVETYKPKATPDTEVSRIRNMYKIVSTIVVADTREQPVPDGTMFSETFMGTEEGLGYFKKAAKNILHVSELKGVPLREILSTLTGAQFKATITIRQTPKQGAPGEFYENVQIRVVPPTAAEAVA